MTTTLERHHNETPADDAPFVRLTPEVHGIARHLGVAGQVAYTATLTYPGAAQTTVTCTGSRYGTPGPVFMTWGDDVILVDSPERFGPWFDRSWMHNFVTGTEV